MPERSPDLDPSPETGRAGRQARTGSGDPAGAPHPSPAVRRERESWLPRLLGWAETLVYLLTALVMVGASLFALGSAAAALASAVLTRDIGIHVALAALDKLLVVLIFAELFYTVRLSVHERGLVVEPFIAVALIATVRRILFLTAEEQRLLQDPQLFQRVLLELGLLAGLVLILTTALVLVRRLRPRGREAEA